MDLNLQYDVIFSDIISIYYKTIVNNCHRLPIEKFKIVKRTLNLNTFVKKGYARYTEVKLFRVLLTKSFLYIINLGTTNIPIM